MRSPSEMDIIQIDAQVGCPKRCSSCTRLVGHVPRASQWEMNMPTFERCVESMEGWGAQGKVLGLIGGEVTTHSDFERMARRFSELWGGPLTKNGRKPIADYNAFVQERLFDRSNGRGLWTSLGPSFYKHAEVILDVFSHFNVNTHEGPAALHQANLIHRKDYIAATGISEEEWERNRDKCWLQMGWSASMNDKGAYFCEQAAAIDRLFYDGKHAWPIEQGWWQRTPADFKDQIKLCDHCSLAQPGPSQLDKADRDIISKENEKVLYQLGSPAVTKGRFDAYDPTVHTEKRVIDRKDNYVGPDGRRCSDEHASVFPKKLTLVVVCVGRAEHLKRTLAHNLKLVDEVVVVTTGDDEQTAAIVIGWRDKGLIREADGIAGTHDHRIKLICSYRCYDDHHAFNKGKMLNDGLAAIDKPDWIICSDADVFLNPRTLGYIKGHALNPGVLYGTTRHDLRTSGDERLFSRMGLAVDEPKGKLNQEPNGYFQCFHHRAFAIRDRWPKVMSENFCSAGGVDSHFLQQYPADKRVIVPELAVGHIHHGETLGEGWNGAKYQNDSLLSGRWVQVGVIQRTGFFEIDKSARAARRFRFTETATGESVEWNAEMAMSPPPAKVTSEGIIFNGRNIGHHHVHVAVWEE